MTTTNFRVRFVHDEHAEFEESNGKTRPLTREEYRENPYFACASCHPVGARFRYAPICALHKGDSLSHPSRQVTYAEYRHYYGNPDAHVYLGCIVEQQCPCCQSWTQAASVWGIDFMADDPDLGQITLDEVLDVKAAIALPGYLGEVGREGLRAAGWEGKP